MIANLMMIDPTRIFEIKGQVYPLLSVGAAFTVGANRVILAAVASYRYRVMGWYAQSTGAAVSTFFFKTNATGISMAMTVPVITNGAIDKNPIVASGYFETNTGEDLRCDVATTDLDLWVFYLKYKP